MPFANFVNLYRDPAYVPEEYRKHPSLARLFRKRARDEEGETRRQDTHLAPGMKSHRLLVPIYAVRSKSKEESCAGRKQVGKRCGGYRGGDTR
jgi:hypothetical protein